MDHKKRVYKMTNHKVKNLPLIVRNTMFAIVIFTKKAFFKTERMVITGLPGIDQVV
jgi:hypothetical protein